MDIFFLSMADQYNISDVTEVLVTIQTGQQYVYRGKGISRLRRVFGTNTTEESIPIIIDDDVDAASDTPDQVKRPTKKKVRPGPPPQTNGYAGMSTNYTIPKGGSPNDIAKEMQRQAESVSGIRYNQ